MPGKLIIPPLAFIAPPLSAGKALQQAAKTLRPTSKILTQKPLADALPWCLTEDAAIISPLLGAPAAALAVELLIRKGVRKIILFGTAGALCGSGLEIGEVFIAENGLAEDGTSRAYGAKDYLTPEQLTLPQHIRQALEQKQIPFKSGCCWTTDAPLLESADKAKHFLAQGPRVVEMEYCAVLQLANLRKIELAAVFVVSDLVGDDDERVKGFESRVVRQRIIQLAEVLYGGQQTL